MTRTTSLETAQRKGSQSYQKGQYVDNDDRSVKSQNTEKVPVEPLRLRTSYVPMFFEEQDREHLT